MNFQAMTERFNKGGVSRTKTFDEMHALEQVARKEGRQEKKGRKRGGYFH
jgi:hypothetical protein